MAQVLGGKDTAGKLFDAGSLSACSRRGSGGRTAARADGELDLQVLRVALLDSGSLTRDL